MKGSPLSLRLAPAGAEGLDADTIVVGSGFGGTMVARELVAAGERVMMVERGGWAARGPEAWGPQGSLELTPHYWRDVEASGPGGRRAKPAATVACVGGASVFYGGVSLRMRAEDFAPHPALAAPAGAWPFGYDEMETHYTAVEQLLDVAGRVGEDPTEPMRSADYPQPPAPLSPISARIATAGAELGLRSFRLPLAINHGAAATRPPCIGCGTCDTFACAIQAKNDLASAVLPNLIRAGLELVTDTLALRLVTSGARVVALEVLDLATRRARTLRARRFVLAAGALGSPHLVLASGLDDRSPAGAWIGRCLTRHCSSIVYGVFPRRLEASPTFHKQLGFHDFYAGDPAARVSGPLGALQQMATPPAPLVAHYLPRPLESAAGHVVPHLTGLLAMAADQPDPANRVRATRRHDGLGRPRLVVEHRHTPRDRAARAHLVAAAKRVLRRAGAVGTYVHTIDTFSHAAGTLGMGADPRRAPVEATGRLRGWENVYVADASALPATGAVNPSLTIAANGLRIGRALAIAGRGAGSEPLAA